jgi:peroxiredoxin
VNRFHRSIALVGAFFLSSIASAVADGIPHAGDAAAAFSVPNARGGSVKLSDYKGKALYLNFFASWCSPCNDEAPSVSGFYKKYHARGLNIVGVNEYEDKSKALGFAKQYGWPFAIAVDGDGAVGHQYGTVALPVHVFIDKNGKVSTFRLGQMDPSEIEAAIKKII